MTRIMCYVPPGYDDYEEKKYKEDLEKRRKKHTESQKWYKDNDPKKIPKRPFVPCIHNQCTECHGTGRKVDGTSCVHMISCPCPKCNPYYCSAKDI